MFSSGLEWSELSKVSTVFKKQRTDDADRLADCLADSLEEREPRAMKEAHEEAAKEQGVEHGREDPERAAPPPPASVGESSQVI